MYMNDYGPYDSGAHGRIDELEKEVKTLTELLENFKKVLCNCETCVIVKEAKAKVKEAKAKEKQTEEKYIKLFEEYIRMQERKDAKIAGE